jgi:hypothetical protein
MREIDRKQGVDRKMLLAGLIFAAIGFTVAVGATRYSLGTTTRMGPGEFPLLIGIILGILGLAHIGVAFASRGGSFPRSGVAKWDGRATLLIPLSAIVFALTIDPFGLVPAIVASVFVATLANPKFRLVEALVLCIALSVFGAGLFVYGLNLPFTLFRTW